MRLLWCCDPLEPIRSGEHQHKTISESSVDHHQESTVGSVASTTTAEEHDDDDINANDGGSKATTTTTTIVSKLSSTKQRPMSISTTAGGGNPSSILALAPTSTTAATTASVTSPTNTQSPLYSVAGAAQEEQEQQREDDNTLTSIEEEDLVSVTIPHGIRPGQSLMVRSPNGARTVSAIVPYGLGPGDTFLVQFPPTTPVSPGGGQSITTSGAVRHNYFSSSGAQRSGGLNAREANAASTPPSFAGALVSPTPEAYATPIPPTQHHTQRQYHYDERYHALSIQQQSPPPPITPETRQDAIITRQRLGLNTVNQVAAPPHGPVITREGAVIQSVEQKFLYVQVPRGLRPGSTIHVEVPGEDRTIAALVPDDASSFHVAYTPRLPKSSSSSPSPSSQPMPQNTNMRSAQMLSPPRPDGPQHIRRQGQHHYNRRNHRSQLQQQERGQQQQSFSQPPSQQHQEGPVQPQQPQAKQEYRHQQQQQQQPKPESSSPRQKLILVRVPPGTMPGTTLHVSIPDEPGRILAAQVPSGNIREFHVSYRPRSTMNAYSGQQPSSSNYERTNETNDTQQQYSGGYDQTYPAGGRGEVEGTGGNNMMVPLLSGAGSAAAAAAGMHSRYNTNFTNNSVIDDKENMHGASDAAYNDDIYNSVATNGGGDADAYVHGVNAGGYGVDGDYDGY